MAEEALREMTGAELKSMLKSSINFKSLGGVRCEELKLPPEDKKWWRDAKVGMFIHWGLYSIVGKGEWAYFNEAIPHDEYAALAEEFDPQDFSPRLWAEIAEDFGAKYCVMVTKHHDGFSLWDSAGSYEQFTSAAHGAHRDFVREYVDACRERGLYVGLYYSPMDWRFPGYFDPKGLPDNAALMKKQCYAQVEELCRDFHPDILWYDGGWLAHQGSDTSSAWFWEPVKLNKMARSYCPKLLMNPRSGWEGDFYCDEGSHEITGKIIPVPWEKNMCVCSGRSWGWMPYDPVSTFEFLIHMMVNVVSRGGNWLVNIGPDRNGRISDEIRDRMHEVGEWLRAYGESIYATGGGPLEPVDHVYGTTFRENVMYLHIMDDEKFRAAQIPMPEDLGNVLHAELLNAECAGGKAVCDIACAVNDGKLQMTLPEEVHTSESCPDLIVKLTLDRTIETQENANIYFTGKE